MRGWCSLKSIISLIKYNNNNEMSRETATWCVTVALRDAVVGRVVVECAVVGRIVVGVRRGGVRRGGACRGGTWCRSGGVLWWECAVVGRDVGNLYLNSGFCRKKVEIPNSAVRESLPKQLFLPGKGRETKFRLPEISTQDRGNRRNG